MFGKPPHPATVVQTKARPAGAVDRKPPHAATVAQRQQSRLPHPATVVQRSAAPHPATLQRREAASYRPHPATVRTATGVAQRSSNDNKLEVSPEEKEVSPEEKVYQDCVNRAKKNLKPGAGNIGKETQQERNEILVQYYKTNTDEMKETGKIITSYNGASDGQYLNYGDKSGTFVADSNHRSPEEKADQEKKLGRSLSNSEIIYHQMVVLSTEIGWKWKKKVKRSRIVNDDAEIVIKLIKSKTDKKEFTEKDEEFYALLGTPNGNGCVWLLRDHAKDLDVTQITKIVLTAGPAMTVFFE